MKRNGKAKENYWTRAGRKNRGHQLAGGLALHDMYQDLGMREGRAWMRVHGAGGRRRASEGSFCKGEKSRHRASKLWQAR